MHWLAGMVDNTPIVLQHGWAFDKSIWEEWAGSQPQNQFLLPDRGYFGEPVGVDYSGVKFAIVHSYGLHLLPDELYEQLECLVIISGFRDFHPPEPRQRNLSEKTIQLMLDKLKLDAFSVVNKFSDRCYKPETCNWQISKKPNADLLYKDLLLLHTQSFNMKKLYGIGKIIILHGKQDVIVDPLKASDLHYALKESNLVHNEDAGHMLPVTHVQWCQNKINELF